MMGRTLQLQLSMVVLAMLLLAAAGHAAEAQSGSGRKLKQNVPGTAPAKMADSYALELAAANMCGVDCRGCRKDTGVAAMNQLYDYLRAFPVDIAVGLNGTYAYHPEECALINFNGAIRQVFEMSAINRLTGNACTFRGFRTWGDVAALWSAPGVGTVFRVEDLKTPSGIMAMLGYAVNQQAKWVETLACDWQAQPYAAWINDVQAFRRDGAFYGATFFQVAENPRTAQSGWIKVATNEPTPVKPLPAGLCSQSVSLCLGSMFAGVQGFPAITCDCSKLPQAAVFAAKPECRSGPPGQVHLNAALSNTAMTGLPWKLGTPLLAGCPGLMCMLCVYESIACTSA